MSRSLLLLLSSCALLFACTTKTIIEHTAPGSPEEPAASGETGDGDATDTSVTPDAGDERRRADASSAPAPSPSPSSSGPDAAPPPDAGPTPVSGGTITLTCPSSGFHKPPPIEIASLPPSLLPRCSASTKTCAYAATTSSAYDACLAADTTPAATWNGESVDCKTCDRTQGSYCLAWACPSEFSAYGCCAQQNGDAACTSLLQAVTSCAGNQGKTAFDACLASVVGACFP